MANTFKRKVLANANTTLTAVYTVPSSTTTVIIGCTLSNVTGASITASAQLVTSGDDTYIVKDIPIPSGSSVEIMAGNKIVMETTDIFKVNGSATPCVDATMSIMEIT
jgi:hypothetical protein